MGWLDNSTNNIILDAVLTDFGRAALARNDGSFSISQFALGDDEINYGIITKYGRTVGREKIEKNTPVFEAFTNQNLALKYKLISVDRPLLYLPRLSINGNQTIALSPSLASVNVEIVQKPQGSDSVINESLLDEFFKVYVPDLFLEISATSPIGNVDINRIATYSISSTIGNNQSEATLKFSITKKSLTSTIFSVYGTTVGNTQQINTSIRVVGQSSGLSVDIPVTVSSV
jgi:hypothetical protein